MDSGQKSMKLGDFLEHFKGVPPNTDVIFGSGNLTFYRTKWRGDSLLQIEFSEIYEIAKTEPLKVKTPDTLPK
ncbi:MAG TPA: hypothetical protein VKV15_02990 [Bryobacteraceae bacterium]|nr:hypothetical protein [Bryobacteraceae bacterium]